MHYESESVGKCILSASSDIVSIGERVYFQGSNSAIFIYASLRHSGSVVDNMLEHQSRDRKINPAFSGPSDET